jgi:hypothetical protein
MCKLCVDSKLASSAEMLYAPYFIPTLRELRGYFFISDASNLIELLGVGLSATPSERSLGVFSVVSDGVVTFGFMAAS